MNELIKVTNKVIGNEEVNAVDARELWIFLESGQQFADWIKDRIEKYEFIEGLDYALHNPMKSVNQAGSWPIRKLRKDYTISIDMAKELAMVENNKKGRDARKYFIQCEKDLKTVQQISKERPQWFVESEALRDILLLATAPESVANCEMIKHVSLLGGPDVRDRIGDLLSSKNILDEDVRLEPTDLGEEFGFSAIQMNQILRELAFKQN